MRRTPVLTDEKALSEAWIELPAKAAVYLPADYGSHFRLFADQPVTLSVVGGTTGRRLMLRIEIDAGAAGSVAFDASFKTTPTIGTAGGAVSWLELVYDDPTGLWDVLPYPYASGLYDAAGAAATAQAAAQSFATAADVAVLAAAEAYADTGDALKLAKASNLSDVASVPAAAHNLGLGAADTPDFSGVKVSGTQVLKTQGSSIADADGTLTDATTKINAILARLRAATGHGLIA